jgi:acetolactate synthase I/II/III large subunit
MLVFEAMADAFHREGAVAHFTLMGDGNMHFAAELAALPGMRTIYVRHEHSAVAMAAAHARATGQPGVASVTCGPGITQLSTALATCVQARIPVVVFAGETPIDAAFYTQRIDQGPVVTATGAHYIAAHSMARMTGYVQEAFFIARTEQRPVVIGVPYDMQLWEMGETKPYKPSTALLPKLAPVEPEAAAVAAAVEVIGKARNIVVLGGRGAVKAGAQAACLRLAELADGLLATTLLGRGLFDADAFSIGIAGGYSSGLAREMFAKADLVIAVGASLNQHSVDGRRLFGHAHVLQIDTHPTGVRDALQTGDSFIRADAKLGVEALVAALEPAGPRPTVWRSPELAERIATEPADTEYYPPENGVMDPRDTVAALDKALPKDWAYVNGTGHSAAFAAHMRGRNPEDFLTIREFGAIGNGLCFGAGMAVARPGKPVVVLDGDGSILMHVQELETISRHRLRLLICVLNDGAYGPEIHKLRKDGIDDSGSIFGRGDFGAIGRAFGMEGRVITSVDQIPAALDAFNSHDKSEIWDLHMSDRVMSSMMRRGVAKRKPLKKG